MILYNIAKTGKIVQWQAEANKEYNGSFTLTYGQVGGKLQVNTKKVLPKNVGRANETTPSEQAIKEVEALYTKQQDKGYVDDIKNVRIIKLPMLAHPYSKRSHNINWPCYVQPKLDGVRCIATRKGNEIEYMSRTGKPYETLEHLTPDLLKVLEDGDCLDGEIFIPDVPLRKIVSLVKKLYVKEPVEFDLFEMEDIKRWGIKTDNTFDDLASEDLQYWVYDMPSDKTFEDRLWKYMMVLAGVSDKIVPVKTVEVKDEADMKIHFSVFVEMGYEGIILRNKKGKYLWGKRSVDLQKYKEFFDAEFPIVDAEQSETGLEKGCVIWVCETPEGNRFNVRPRGTREEKRELYLDRNKYIGKQLTVRYQMLIDETNIPQFPVGVTLRDYE